MIYVMSGGGTKLFAAIGVKFSAGSTLTCTCKENGKVLTAKTTSDQTNYVFAVPNAGTWTVADVTKGKSETRHITKAGQFESINIAELVLFNNGVVDAITGGFEGSASGSGDFSRADFSVSGVNLSLSVESGYGSRAVRISTKNAIDVTQYNTISFDVDTFSKENDATFEVGIAQSYLNNDFVASAKVNEVGTVAIDVSELQGNYFPALYGFARYESAWTTRGEVIATTKKIVLS